MDLAVCVSMHTCGTEAKLIKSYPGFEVSPPGMISVSLPLFSHLQFQITPPCFFFFP